MIENNIQKNKEILNHNLSDNEKALMKERVFAYVNSHPARMRNDFYDGFRIYFSKKSIATYSGALMLFFIASGTLAETANPGDFFYPFKLNVNESLLSTFSLNNESKAQTHLFLAERRIAEMEKLTLNKSVDKDALDKLSADFKTQALKVNKYVDDLRLSGEVETALDLSGTFEAKLGAHKKILMQISSVSTTTEPFISSMINEIDDQNDISEESQIEMGITIVESKDETGIKKTVDDNVLKVEEEINELKKHIEENDKNENAHDFTDESKKLIRAEKLLSATKEELEDSDFKSAVVKQGKADKVVEEVSTLIKVKTELNLDIKEGAEVKVNAIEESYNEDTDTSTSTDASVISI